MQKTKIKLAVLLSLFVVLSHGKALAQNRLTSDYLASVVTAGNQLLAKGMENNPDSSRAAIANFDIYINALNDKSTSAIAEKAYDAWQVLSWKSLACALIGDENGLDANYELIKQYYDRKGRNNFHDYFYALERSYRYYHSTQNFQRLVPIAEDIHNAAVESGEQSFLLFIADYMKACAEIMKGSDSEAMKWLEQSHEIGQIYEKDMRNFYCYDYYLDMLWYLGTAYQNLGNYEKGLSTVDELISCLKSLDSSYPLKTSGPQFLTLLTARCNFLQRLGRNDELKEALNDVDSVCHNDETIDKNYVAQVLTAVDEVRKSLENGTSEQQDDYNALYWQARNDIEEKRFSDAKEKYLKFLSIYISQPNVSLEQYNTALNFILECFISNGEYQYYAEILDNAESFIKSKFPSDGTALRVVEMDRGVLLSMLGDNEQSLRYLNRAKQMFDITNDKGENYFKCLYNLENKYFQLNDLAYAKLFCDEIIAQLNEMIADKNASSNVDVQVIMASLYSTYASLGYDSFAKQNLEKLVTTYGKNSTSVEWSMARLILGILYAEDKEYDKAIDVFKNSLENPIGENERQIVMRALATCTLLQGNPEAIDYQDSTNCVTRKQVADVMMSFPNMQKQSFWEATTLALSSSNNLLLKVFPDNRKVTTMAYDNALYVKSMQNHNLHDAETWSDVRNSLSANDVAIEFVTVPEDIDGKIDHYGALLVRKGMTEPKYIDICNSRAVDDMWLYNVNSTDTTLINSIYSLGDTKLYELLWKKIEPLLHNGDNVYLSPTGFLCRVNFDAISNGEKRLSDIYNLHLVWTTADIGKIKAERPSSSKKAVVYGGLLYDESTAEMAEAAKGYEHKPDDNLLASRSVDGTTRGAMETLAGTLDEAENITDILETKGYKVDLRTADKGNEESLKALDGKAPQIIHIATHGFLVTGDYDRMQHSNIFNRFANNTTNGQTSLIYSGLLMSGAYNAWNGQKVPKDVDDGILTAYEVSQIDLRGCRLVVLSACETGLGIVDVFNGDIGLRQAFKIAGAEMVVASLWKVPDTATSILMKSFYNSVAAGMAPQQALRTAQMDVAKEYPEPYNWAGFTIMN